MVFELNSILARTSYFWILLSIPTANTRDEHVTAVSLFAPPGQHKNPVGGFMEPLLPGGESNRWIEFG
jgi:hypothetical protein